MPPVQRRSETKKENRLHTPHALTITPVTVSDVVHVERTAQGTRIPDARREHDGRIIIIAVFWLLGLLMAWSMCVVAARADRRMEEIRHTHTDTDISRPADTGHVD